MPKVALYNVSGAQVGDIELSEQVFGIDPNEGAMHQVVKMQLANYRVGTSSTKSRAEVRGGGRKPFKQKGTGRARAGSNRSPVWRKGGVVFGPKPRDFSYTLPRKLRRLALRSALSTKVIDQNIIVLDNLNFEEPKTREMIGILAAVGAKAKALVVTVDGDANVVKSARNIPGIKPVRADFINVYDLLNYETLVITRDAVAMVEEVLG